MSLFKVDIPFPSDVLSIGDLTQHIKKIIEHDGILAGVWVQGEVSNLVKAASGHCYFTLKDDKAVIKAAMWSANRRRIGIDFKNGDSVMVFGSVSVYPPRGEYQIIVNDLRLSGAGALYEAYEKLKKKLLAEGLFDQSRKMKFPLIPKGIGVVTSPHGAVIQDIFRVVRRRFRNMPIYLVPSKVQGDGASKEIAAGIARLNLDPRVDVIIVARGGGSIEDLWPFNEEIVARAISESKKPIISAVGHETDTTIADLVADKRAATPSVAGELAVPVKSDLINILSDKQKRIVRSMRGFINYHRQYLMRLAESRFFSDPVSVIEVRRSKLSDSSRDMLSAFKILMQKVSGRFKILQTKLYAADPSRILQKGYILATDAKDQVVRSAFELKKKQKITLHFADGKVDVVVNAVPQGEK